MNNFTIWVIAIFASIFLLVFLVAFSPSNTICPHCKKRKQFNDFGWKMPCNQC